MRRYGELIERTAFRIARRWSVPTPELIDDLAQETYVKLCASGGNALREYRTLRENSDFGFIKVFTANVVLDHFRSMNAQKRQFSSTISLSGMPEPEAHTENLDRALTLRTVDDCLDRIVRGPTRERDRLVFYLYYRHGMSAQSISKLSTVALTREGVESLLGRLTRSIRTTLAAPRDSINQSLGGNV